MDDATAFEQGWSYGDRYGEASMREIETVRPDLSVSQAQAFAQGTVDGAIGDRYRLDLVTS